MCLCYLSAQLSPVINSLRACAEGSKCCIIIWLSYFIQMDLPDDEPDRLNNRTFQYDPGQDKWTERSQMKYSKYRFSTAVVNQEIYVLGKSKQIFNR